MTDRTHRAGIKRSLTHVGGEVDLEGDSAPAKALAHALDVAGALAPEKHALPDEPASSGDDEEDRAHVHGFHTYPARMHPLTAQRLVTAFSAERALVLDPFAGSGTVLVEAMIAGRDALGTDLNPLAVRLARCKTAPRSEASQEKLLEAAARARAFADDRRKRKAGATRRYEREDVATFDPHVLLELDSLRASANSETDANVRADLLLVLSAILVKVSRKRSDTAHRDESKRIAAGYTSKLFLRKAEELVRRARVFESLLPTPRPRARVREDDARTLTTVEDASVDAIVSSPPYAATYDYLMHHAMRLRWLGLASEGLMEHEIGSRRRYARLLPAQAEHQWKDELGRFFEAARRVVKPGGAIVLVLADSETGGHALRAETLAAAAARKTGLVPVARASQARPHFHDARAFAKSPRREHALYFEKVRR